MLTTLAGSSCFRCRLAIGTNSTAANFTAKVPTTTRPTLFTPTGTSAFHDVAGESKVMPSFIGVMPWATAANDVIWDMRVWGWHEYEIRTDANTPILYVPKLLIQVGVVAGNIAAGLGTNTFFADTITNTYGDATALLINPQNDLAGSFYVDLKGARYVEFDFDKNTATAMNALWWHQS